MKSRIEEHRFGGKEIVIHREFCPNEIGDLAIRFATHFGIIAAKEDGEDRAGRAKIALQTVDHVVQRSCDLAQKLWEEMDKRGWILKLPELPPVEPTK